MLDCKPSWRPRHQQTQAEAQKGRKKAAAKKVKEKKVRLYTYIIVY